MTRLLPFKSIFAVKVNKSSISSAFSIPFVGLVSKELFWRLVITCVRSSKREIALDQLIFQATNRSQNRTYLIHHCYSKHRHSSDPLQDSCSVQNGRKVSDLQNDCSADGKNFDSWVTKYTTSNDLYNKFTPCSGSILNEQRVKMVIKFCYCYNFCGSGQTRNGCEVEGLEGRLDLGANLFSSYKAMYVIGFCWLTLNVVGMMTNLLVSLYLY